MKLLLRKRQVRLMKGRQNTDRQIIQAWKIPHLIKGSLTWLPFVNAWRLRRGVTGGSDSSRYCYSVWLRHLRNLDKYGFRLEEAQIGELGPGDSIGIGLAALLSGADSYVGLDVVPYSTKANLSLVLNELVDLYSLKQPIPNENEFPSVRPRLSCYEFPSALVDSTRVADRAEKIRRELKQGLDSSHVVRYRAPWTSIGDVAPGTLDLIFSQAVLEHVECLPDTYRAMFAWLKRGGYSSHVIDFSAHYLSPFWNGHWAYSHWQWKLVRGRREFLLNREPLSTHLICAEEAGFEVLQLERDYDCSGLDLEGQSRRFIFPYPEDAQTRGATLILRKPQ